MKKCTYEEIEAFIKTYPRKLERDVFGAYEPPLVTYNDFTLGVWPESVIASYRWDSIEDTKEDCQIKECLGE